MVTLFVRRWSQLASKGDHDHICEAGILHLGHHTCSYCGYSW